MPYLKYAKLSHLSISLNLCIYIPHRNRHRIDSMMDAELRILNSAAGWVAPEQHTDLL